MARRREPLTEEAKKKISDGMRAAIAEKKRVKAGALLAGDIDEHVLRNPLSDAERRRLDEGTAPTNGNGNGEHSHRGILERLETEEKAIRRRLDDIATTRRVLAEIFYP